MKSKNNKKIIVLSIFMITVFSITMFLGIELNTYATGEEEGNNNMQYANVMSSVKDITIANPRYIDLAMLASHGASTVDLKTDGILDYSANNTLSRFYPIIKGIQYRFGKTQNTSVYNQLMQGSRCLQLKVTPFEDNWYCSHSTLCDKLDKYIIEILQFLDYCEQNNYGEIVSIIFNATYFDKNHTAYDLNKHILSVQYNNKTLLDYVHYSEQDLTSPNERINICDLTYNELTNNGKSPSIILLDELNYANPDFLDLDKIMQEPNYFAHLGQIANPIPWCNRASTKLILDDIKNELPFRDTTPRYGDKLNFMQAHASFTFRTFDDAMAVINDWSLLQIAEKLNAALIEDEQQFLKLLSYSNILQVDYVNSNYKDFNNRVNKLIKKYNEKLVENILAM